MMVVIILVTLTGQKFTSGKKIYLQNLFWITMEMGLLCIADVQGREMCGLSFQNKNCRKPHFKKMLSQELNYSILTSCNQYK